MANRNMRRSVNNFGILHKQFAKEVGISKATDTLSDVSEVCDAGNAKEIRTSSSG
jgi:hypothetical protein